MTDDDLHGSIVKWLVLHTGRPVIRAYQSGPLPAAPYIMVNYTGSKPVRQHVQAIDFFDTGIDNGEGKTRIKATPAIEREWRYSVHALGSDAPADLLRPIESAAKMLQTLEQLHAKVDNLMVHEISQIRNVPEWVNTQWEPRAQMDIFVRGVTLDGFIVDTIDDSSYSITRDLTP